MKFRFAILLFSITLCVEAQAPPTPENQAVFDHAMLLGNSIQERIAQLIVKEQEGKIDKFTMSQSIQEAAKGTEEVEAELRKASAGGHGVATYVLANMQDGRAATFLGDSKERHAEACSMYQHALDQGLIAAAVIVLRNCDEAFLRFQLDDPELLRKHSQLVNALEQPDLYSDYYPLPARGSYCFQDLGVPQVNPKQPLATVRDALQPVSLSLEQFRGDGYYLLALQGDIASPKVRAFFKQVQMLAPDCLDPFNLQALSKDMESKSP